MKNIFVLLTFLIASLNLLAQEIMTVENAILLAMEKNFDILAMKNNLEIASNNKSIYNTGYLPAVSASGGAGYSLGNTLFILKNNDEVEITGAESTNYNGGVAVNYVLFNGFARKERKEILTTLFEVADAQKKGVIKNVLFRTYNTYYSIARTELRKEILEHAYEISKERLTRITYQYNYGQKTNLEVLNAKVDANNDSLSIENIKVQIANAKRNLNFLTGEYIDKQFEVEKNVIVDESLIYSDLLAKMLESDENLSQLEFNKSIAKNNLNINKSGYLPSLSTQAGYNLSNSQFEDNIQFQSQNTNGLNLGLSLSWNIFDGGRTKTLVQNSKIELLNLELNKEQLKLDLINQISISWANYQYQLGTIKSEKLNIELSEQNFLRTKERYNLGQISSIDFRQAQLNFINANMKLNQAQFDAKNSELELLFLSGEIIN